MPLPVCHEPDGFRRTDGPRPGLVLPGSFNPLHHGHTGLAVAAERAVGRVAAFELSVTNADKPELSDDEVERRVRQFRGTAAVWVTRAAAFEKKADLFPGAAFALGWDTAVRLIDPRYYGGEERRRDAALRKLLERQCVVVVGGRVTADGRFREWDGVGLSADVRGLFLPLTAADFRADVSSSELRAVRLTSAPPTS